MAVDNSWQTRHKIFIVSAGRTGTEFFGELVGKLSPDFFSIHEPDLVGFAPATKKRLKERLFVHGFWKLFVLKALGVRGTRNLSLKRINGKISAERALELLFDDRTALLEKAPVYIEANAQLYGLVSELANAPNSKVAIIYRDPRTWVQSWMNRAVWYTDKDLMSRINMLGFKRVTPENVGEYNTDWKNYDTFEKLCWAWNFYNSLFFKKAAENPEVKTFTYEELFLEKNKTKLQDFLQHILQENFKPEFVDALYSRLSVKLNKSDTYEYPSWKEWNNTQCITLQKHCGTLMQKLNYGTEAEWLKKLQ